MAGCSAGEAVGSGSGTRQAGHGREAASNSDASPSSSSSGGSAGGGCRQLADDNKAAAEEHPEPGVQLVRPLVAEQRAALRLHHYSAKQALDDARERQETGQGTHGLRTGTKIQGCATGGGHPKGSSQQPAASSQQPAPTWELFLRWMGLNSRPRHSQRIA